MNYSRMTRMVLFILGGSALVSITLSIVFNEIAAFPGLFGALLFPSYFLYITVSTIKGLLFRDKNNESEVKKKQNRDVL